MGKKHFCFFQTAETGNRTPNSGVKGSGANHYPRAPAQYTDVRRAVKISAQSVLYVRYMSHSENRSTECDMG